MGCPECDRLGAKSRWHEPKQPDISRASAPAKKVHPVRGKSRFEDDVADQFSEAANLLLAKHAAYGPGNIANAPGGPLNGLLVRMWDKMARLKHIMADGGEDRVSESIRETAIDLCNYAAIMCLVLDKKWPTGDKT